MAWLALLCSETLLIALGLFALTWFYIHRKWQYFMERNIPTDTPSIFKLGTIGVGGGQKLFHQDLDRKQRLGLVYGVYVGLNPNLVVNDLEIMRQIFTKEFKNFPDRQAVFTKMNGKDMNHGLTVVAADKWKRIRMTMTPTFTTSKLKQVFSIIDDCAEQTVAVLQKKKNTDGGKFIPRMVLSNLSLDVIVSAALGTKANPQVLSGEETRLSQEVRKSFKNGFSSFAVLIVLLFPSLETVFEKLGIGLFPQSSLDYVGGFVRTVIGKRAKNGLQEGHKDLLQLLLDAEVPDKDLAEDKLAKGLTRQEIVGNALLMVGAGFENTANSMVFLAYNLAFHPDVQKRLQDEVDSVVNEKGGVDYSAINGMKYLEMCVNESLRLYNPVLMNSRICRRETTINGLTIPNGMPVNIPTFALSHDQEYWEDPWEFKPQRMEDMSKIDPMVYQPFGAGPRNCIGSRFALMEMKITFFKLLQNFNLEPCDDTPKPPLELGFGIGVRPAKEFELRVIPRNPN